MLLPRLPFCFHYHRRVEVSKRADSHDAISIQRLPIAGYDDLACSAATAVRPDDLVGRVVDGYVPQGEALVDIERDSDLAFRPVDANGDVLGGVSEG